MWGRIVDLHWQALELPPELGLERLFLRLRDQPQAALLLSGTDLDCARYSVIAWDPGLVLSAKGRLVELHTPAGMTWRWQHSNPFVILDDLLAALALPGETLVAPLSAGLLGYLAFELKNHLERLPQTARDDLGLPELYLTLPRRLVVQDRWHGTATAINLVYETASGSRPPASGPGITDLIAGTVRLAPGPYWVGELRSNFQREAYLQAVTKAREYIRQGDIYQVNLSQRFSFSFRGDFYRLLLQLFQRNPAPFYAYLNCGSFQILSTSMERFLYRRGDYLETRPIKGTRPRGRTPEEDAANRQELLSSPKEDAELSMIVDLLRNDLGRVCRPGTVQVQEHKRLEAYTNVYHLISIITGQLSPGTSNVDILRAAFPGGSISGCPKIRALEIIDELEPVVRQVYCGSIGYLGLHRNLDLNIAIRTAICSQGQVHFAVGGGIVYDSEEEAEYEETLHKGRTLFDLLGRGQAAALPQPAGGTQRQQEG